MLVLAALIVYSDSFHGPLIFDDVPSIMHTVEKQPWPVWHMLVGLRPVAQATLALNYFIGGYRETGYHVVNLCIHILAALALFGVIRRTLMLTSFGGRFDEKAATSLAFAVALIWAIHPIQTQAVTYVIQRLESLMGLFYLLTLYCFIRAGSSPKPLFWHAAAVAACALGMGSKEVMISAPLIVLLCDRSFVAGSFRAALKRRAFYIGLAATWLILARSVIEAVNPHAVSAGFQYPDVTPFEYARSQPGVILHYLALAFWPANLCFDYGWPAADGLEQIAPGAIVIGGMLAATVWALVRKPKWGFLGAWFFLILAPTSSVMPIKDLAVEHRMYLPLAAIAVAVIFAAYLAWERCAGADATRRAAGQILATILLLSATLALGHATFMRNKDYASVMAIWSDTAKKAPLNPRALNNLGWELRNAGDYPAALNYLNRAIELRPKYADAYNNLAYTYASMKRYDEAFVNCNKAIALKPDLAAPYNNRGNLYAQRGDVQNALADFDQAISLKPGYHQAYNNRGVVYVKAGRYQEAIGDFDKAIEIMPEEPTPYRGRASAYYALKDYARALADLDTCAKLHGNVDPALQKAVMQAAGQAH